MADGKSTAKFIELHIFGGKVQDEQTAVEEIDKKDRHRGQSSDGTRRPSAYVTTFESKQQMTVLFASQ